VIELPPPDRRARSHLADWVELELLFGDNESLSHADLLDALTDDPLADRTDEELAELEAVYGEEVDDQFAADRRLQARQQAEEGLDWPEQVAEATWMELSFRSQVVGECYPLLLDDRVARSVDGWRQTTIYAFLALLAARVAYSLPVGTNVPARRFEDVVRLALKAYTGGDAVRFGWPHDRNEFPSDFKKAAHDLARQLGERPGGMEAIGPNAKDYALDVVAWRGFDDARRGQQILLCQCATGKDWNEKMLSIRAWEKVIDFAVAPTSSLAFPFVPERLQEGLALWLDVAYKGGIPFDRLRIASLAKDAAAPAQLLEDLQTWVDDVSPQLPGAQ
jgi:hypothetical protein